MRRRVLAWLGVGFSCLALAHLTGLSWPDRAQAQEKSAAPKTAPADAKASLVNGLPKETTILLRAPNMKSFVSKLKSSPAYALKDHPDVKSLLAKIQKEAGEGLASIEKELGFDPIEFLTSIDGEWIIALGNLEAVATAVGESLSVGQAPEGLSPEIFPVVIAADASSSQDKVKERLGKIYAFAEKQGAKRETVDFKGGKITRITEGTPGAAGAGEKKDGDKSLKPSGDGDSEKKSLKSKDGKSDSAARADEDDDKADAEKDDKDDDGNKDKDKDENEAPKHVPVSLYVGELAGRVYFSLSRAFLESCMQKPDATVPDSLAANALYQETQKMTGGGDLHAFVNVKQLTSSIGSALSTTFFAFFWQKFDALMFGKSLNNFGVAVQFDENLIRESFFAHNSGASDGLLGVFKSEPFPVAIPSAVPGDSQTFNSIAFNPEQLGKIVKELVQTAMAFQGQAQDVDALLESQVGVKLSELIGGLGRRIHSFASAPKSDNPFASINYVLELKDEAPIKKLLKKVSELAQGEMQTEKFKERDLYSVDTGNFGLNLTTTDKLFVISGSRAEVEKVINRAGGNGPALAETEDYKKAVAGLPAKVSLLGYSAPDYMKTSFKAMAEELKGSLDADAEQAFGALGALGDILGSGIAHGVWNESGFLADVKVFYRKK